jgi:hypothetical protein
MDVNQTLSMCCIISTLKCDALRCDAYMDVNQTLSMCCIISTLKCDALRCDAYMDVNQTLSRGEHMNSGQRFSTRNDFN